MHNCNQTLQEEGKAYPRTCAACGLGPCKRQPKPEENLADTFEVELEFSVEHYTGFYGQQKQWSSFRHAQIKSKTRGFALKEFAKILKANEGFELRLVERTTFTPKPHKKDTNPFEIC